MYKIFKFGRNFISFLLFILLLSGINSYSQQKWETISRPTCQNLWKCSFVDTLNGWAVGDSGTILYTSNGGYNWVTQNSHLIDYMTSVFFLNKRLGWAIAWGLDTNFYGSYLLKTTNGGISWDTTRYPVVDTYIRTIIFLDSLKGYLGGSPAFLMKTTNGGINWTRCSVDTTVFVSGFPINRFRFYNDRFGIACGGVMDIAGVIWKTTNFGEFWSVQTIAAEPVNDIKIFDTLHYLAVAGDYEYGASILRTTNGGLNWDYKTLGFFGVPAVLSFRNNYEGWAPMGYLKKFLKTTDTGVNWNLIDTPDSTGIFDLVFINTRFGIGVGLNGAVIKYKSCPMYTISGTVKYNDNNQPVQDGYVKAFKLDKTTGNLVILDSTVIQPNGTYLLGGVSQDSLDIGVFPNSTPPNDWVITYFPSAIYWKDAVTLYPTANLNNIDVSAVRMILTNANNFISGKVIRQSSTLTENLKDAVVYAKNGNTYVNYAVTDENGDYIMQSLPTGNIKILVNRFGFTNDSTFRNVTATSNIDSVNFSLQLVNVGIKQISGSIPLEYKLFQNYPNPFNPATNIRYQIRAEARSQESEVRIIVFDILGKEVVTLVNQKQKPGYYEVSFDGSKLSSGIYFYRLQAGEFVNTKRMILVK